MTIEQAKAKLAELEPQHAEAWRAVQQAEELKNAAQAKWHPIYDEMNKLKTFISVAEQLKEAVANQ